MTGHPIARAGTALALVCALVGAAFTPVLAEDPATPPVGFEVHGKVLGREGEPVVGVTVMAYNLATEALFTTTTDPMAGFSLIELPNGYYDFAVRSFDGFYVGDQVANVGPLGETRLEFHLRGYDDELRPDRWYFPGSDDTPTGVAEMVDPEDGESFWLRHKSAKYLIGGGGALALLLLRGGGGRPASASRP